MSTRRPESRFARWSRLKSAARRGDTAPPAADDRPAPEPPQHQGSARPAAPEEDASADRPQPREAGDGGAPELTPIEELGPDSDYTQFLAEDVPPDLAKAALRKLWRSDSVFANLDGLNDYDEDFNLVDRLITLADTDYRPGRGLLGEPEPEPDPEQQEEADQAAADADAGPGTDSLAAGPEPDRHPPDRTLSRPDEPAPGGDGDGTGSPGPGAA